MGASLLETFDPQKQMEPFKSVLIDILPMLPGLYVFSWTLMMLVNGSLAQGILVKYGKNLRPSPSLIDLDASNNFVLLLGLSLVLSFVGVGSLEVLGKNAAFILVFPFFLIGLGMVHHWFQKTSYPTTGLTVFYFMLFLFLWPAFFLIVLGIMKPWIEKIYPSDSQK